jgi:hypothetical protein
LNTALNEKQNGKKTNGEIVIKETNEDIIGTHKNDSPLYNNLKYSFNYFRSLLVIIDMTETMTINDYKPTRFKFLLAKIEKFLVNYFKYNYISTITLLSMRNYTTHIIYPNAYEPNSLLQFLSNEKEPQGYPSIFNALNVR